MYRWISLSIFSLNIWTLKLVILKASSQSAFYRSELSEICKMKQKNLKLIITSMIILKQSTNLKSVNQFIESAFIQKQSIQVNSNYFQLIQSIKKEELINIAIIEVIVYQTLVKNKKIKIFILIINEINKALHASSVEDFAKLNEITSIMLLNELKKKLSIVYYNFLNMFDREKIMQLLLHWSYNHKIKLKDEN